MSEVERTIDAMSDDTEDASPKIPHPSVSINVPKRAVSEQALTEQEKRLTPSQGAVRDLKLGISPKWDGFAIAGIREMALRSTALSASFKAPGLDGFAPGLVASLNVTRFPGLSGIKASEVAAIQSAVANSLASSRLGLSAFPGLSSSLPVLSALDTTALAALRASMAPGFRPGALASASLLTAAASDLPKLRTDQFLSSGTFSALQAARFSAMKFDFRAMTDRPAGVLGKLDAALHVDLGLGAAADSLIAAPTRRGPVGFDYGAIQRQARQVDDALSESTASADLTEILAEAQDATGLEDEQMSDFSQFLGIPAPTSPGGVSAAKILFVSAVGLSCVTFDVAAGHVFTATELLGLLINGVVVWTYLHKSKSDD